MPLLLLTNDADNRRKALAEGLSAMGVYAFAKSLKDEAPELLDLVAAGAAADDEEGEQGEYCLDAGGGGEWGFGCV